MDEVKECKECSAEAEEGREYCSDCQPHCEHCGADLDDDVSCPCIRASETRDPDWDDAEDDVREE